jgi:hypothetical protein
LARRWEPTNEEAKKNSTLPLTFSMLALPLRWNLSCFPQTSLNHPVSKEFYHFVHIRSPFGNELIKHKPREVDAMHEIKIRVLHKLYQQLFKATMLNKMQDLQKKQELILRPLRDNKQVTI